MVDVSRVPGGGFGSVPTPALVAPIEFTLRVSDYAALGGHMGEVRPCRSSGSWRAPPAGAAPGRQSVAAGAGAGRPA